VETAYLQVHICLRLDSTNRELEPTVVSRRKQIYTSRFSHNGTASFKFVASQARTIFQYKNTRIKVLKCCANIYLNKECLVKKVIPGYANIKLSNTSPATRTTQKKVHVMRIKDQLRFLYKKKHIVIVARTQKKLTEAYLDLEDETSKLGMEINEMKTKYSVSLKDSSGFKQLYIR
jgi:hypothetical protein